MRYTSAWWLKVVTTTTNSNSNCDGSVDGRCIATPPRQFSAQSYRSACPDVLLDLDYKKIKCIFSVGCGYRHTGAHIEMHIITKTAFISHELKVYDQLATRPPDPPASHPDNCVYLFGKLVAIPKSVSCVNNTPLFYR